MARRKRKSIIEQISESQSFLSYLKEWMPLAHVVGISSGIVMMTFYFSIIALQSVLAHVPVYLSMAIGGLLTSLFLWLGIKKTAGSGVHHYINCRKGVETIELKEMGSKFLASSAAIGSGCIAGKEGPAMFIGGGIALFWARLLKFPVEKIKMTVTIGGAAATSAIFQAPLGGAIFATEVPYRHDIDAPEYMPAFLSSLISYFIFRYGVELITGDVPRILDLHITGSFYTLRHFFDSFIVGFVAGLVGVLFVKTFHFARVKIAPRFRPEVSVMIGIGISAIITFVTLKIVMTNVPFGGTGFHILNYIESHPDVGVNFLITILVATILACSFTVGMNVSGGVFGPALVVGGSTGGIVGLMLDPANVSAYIVIGMSAVHTAVTKTPIASLVLIMEMTNFPPIFLAMAIANVAAFFISGDNSLYHTQMRERFEEIIKDLIETDVLARFDVEDVMQRDVICIRENRPVSEAKKLFSDTRKHMLPVTGPDNVLQGVLMADKIRKAGDDTVVKEVAIEPPLSLNPEDSLKDALYKFYDTDVERAPVVDKDGRLIGFITLRNIIHTHREHVAG